MRRHSPHRPARRLRRWTAGGLTAALLAAGAAGTVGTAHADEPPAPVPVTFAGPDSYDLSLDAEPVEGEPEIELRLKGPGEAETDEDGVYIPVHRGEYSVTIDATGMAGVADVNLPCGAEGLVAVCTEYDLYGGTEVNPRWDIGLAVSGESEAGDLGTITVTGEGEGLEFTEHTVDVLVGGPEFRMRELSEPAGFAPGDTYEAPLGFRNAGGTAANGVVLRFGGSRGLSFPEEYGNCEYAVEEEGDLLRMRRVALCTFEGTFAPGAAYALDRPVAVKTAGFALNDIFHYYFTALSPEEADRLREGADYRRGDGRKLTLEPVGNADPGDYAQYAELDFPTRNSYDLDLTGERVGGAEGETVTVDVALHNHGPAWLGALRSGGEPVSFTVDIPEGATVTEAPRACGRSNEEGGERDDRYLCWAGTPLLEKDSEEFPFELRIDKVVRGAKGAVRLPEWGGGANPWEGDPANDTGWIVLNGTGDEETPGDTGGPGGNGDGPGEDGEDPGEDGEDGKDPGEDAEDGKDPGEDGADAGGGDGSTGGDTGGDGSGDGALALTGTSALVLGGAALVLLAAGAGVVFAVRGRRAGGAGGTGGAVA
ncbi:hypothetical protein [Streptomyces carminius]|uniref:hypothetical protein n=1 Tax=Streptomyces carminius TaxID=2665496 RepID=UPI0013041B2F|nr:hypothetical protein [Streptomyces carminius]